MRQLKLILASTSPRRKALLNQLGLRFEIIPSNTDETMVKKYSPALNVKRIALRKAINVARDLKTGIVLGADTIVVLDGKIINKPKSREEAKKMLKMLSGRTHKVYTGFALVDARSRRHIEAVERTIVKFRQLEQEEIDTYVRSGAPMDKAGAYGIQDDFGAVFIEKISGCYYNVVGLPLTKFYVTYRKFLKDLRRTNLKGKILR